jgi:DNA-binding NtrC family response regulator
MGAIVPRDAGSIRSLHTVRILLAADDARFMRAARFLLEREGFAVVGACATDVAPTRARIERPHAVVVDGNESAAAAERTAFAIEASGLPLRVLVVASGGGRRGGLLTRTAECGSFAELSAELRRLYGS